jgi:hypothetical protein
MVGARGFEPPTPCSQSRCATRLRHTPTGSHTTAVAPDAIPSDRFGAIDPAGRQRRFPLLGRRQIKGELEYMIVRTEA